MRIAAALLVLGSFACKAKAPPAKPTSSATPATFTTNRPRRVLGGVFAHFSDFDQAINGAKVSLRDATGATVAAVTSSPAGRYEVPTQPAGTYALCADAPGVVSACDPTPVVLDATTFTVFRELLLTPNGIRGRVLLADGRPCFHASATFGSALAAAVSVAGDAPVSVNSAGQFVLGLGAGTYTLAATCGAASASQDVVVDASLISGQGVVDIDIANSPPVLEPLVLLDDQGAPVKNPAPGQTLTLAVSAQDADGDALTYQYSDATGQLDAASGASLTWVAPSTAGSYLINVEVSDGRGGFADDAVEFSTGTPAGTARFLGQLTDSSGAPIGSLTGLTIDGQPVSVDEEGNFGATVAAQDRHLVLLKTPGYPLVARAFYDSASDIALIVPATAVQVVDPTAAIDVSIGPASLHLPANALLSDAGRPPFGALTLYTYRYDATQGELPGDTSALGASGDALAFVGIDALHVEFRDDAGTHYNVAPWASAVIDFPAPAQASPVESFTLAHFDEGSGTWTVSDVALLSGDQYEGIVPSFSVWSMGTTSDNRACVKVSVDPYTLLRPFNLRVTVPPANPSEFGDVRNFVVSDKVNVLEHLPPGRRIDLDILPSSNSNASYPAFEYGFHYSVNTGSNVGGTPSYPYDACGSEIRLAAELPAKDWLYVFPGSKETATAYNAANGATDFSTWRTKHSFDVSDVDNEVVFYNQDELGLGRRLNCKKAPGANLKLACYVTKFGEIGGSPTAAFDDTIYQHNPGDTVGIAMDNNANVTFYAWGPDGQPKTATLFDTSGKKYLPDVCLHCHGQGGNGYAKGGSLVVIDPNAYLYPGVSKSSPYSLDAQQEKFRKINQVIGYAHGTDDAYGTFANSLYPDGIDTPGSKAIASPVPKAWIPQADLYQKVVKPLCRTCHMWQGDANSAAGGSWLNFENPPDPLATLQGGCWSYMPQAMNPMLRIWRSIDLYQELGCQVSGKPGHPPKVDLSVPNGAVGYGGLFDPIALVANVSDHEDGASCCRVVWSSDVDGVLGEGTTLGVSMPSPGPRIVTAQVYDDDGNLTEANAALDVVNNPPSVGIDQPADGSTVYQNTPVTFLGHLTDPNESGSCSELAWTLSPTSNPAFPANACQFDATFTDTGSRTITLTGTDAYGATDAATVTVNVVAPPPNTPCVETITNPPVGKSFAPGRTIDLRGTITDPDGDGPTKTVTWKVKDLGTTQVLHTRTETAASFDAAFDWPIDLPGGCSPRNFQIILEATDPDGTTSTSITLSYQLSPC